MESAEAAVIELIRARSVWRGLITRESALYHDLRIWGDDAREILAALHKQFGTTFHGLDFPTYFPREGIFNDFFAWRARAKRPRLTVGHLIDVVDLGHWSEPVPR